MYNILMSFTFNFQLVSSNSGTHPPSLPLQTSFLPYSPFRRDSAGRHAQTVGASLVPATKRFGDGGGGKSGTSIHFCVFLLSWSGISPLGIEPTQIIYPINENIEPNAI
jgi:hypothetical protein